MKTAALFLALWLPPIGLAVEPGDEPDFPDRSELAWLPTLEECDKALAASAAMESYLKKNRNQWRDWYEWERAHQANEWLHISWSMARFCRLPGRADYLHIDLRDLRRTLTPQEWAHHRMPPWAVMPPERR